MSDIVAYDVSCFCQIITFVASDFCLIIGFVPYYVCRLIGFVAYDVCRPLWRLSLTGLVSVSVLHSKIACHEVFSLRDAGKSKKISLRAFVSKMLTVKN